MYRFFCVFFVFLYFFFRYSFISLVGLCLSIIIFYVLQVYANLSVLSSNLLGDISALSLVFFVSWRRIFVHHGRKFMQKYLLSTSVKLATIFVLSYLLDFIDSVLNRWVLELNPSDIEIILIVCKILLAPLTLILNYFITKYFIHER